MGRARNRGEAYAAEDLVAEIFYSVLEDQWEGDLAVNCTLLGPGTRREDSNCEPHWESIRLIGLEIHCPSFDV
jgi:hypothetical protein